MTFILIGFLFGISLIGLSSFRTTSINVNPGGEYSGSKISNDAAKQMIKDYKSNSGSSKCGAFISKSMIRNLMDSNAGATGINVYFGQNEQRAMELLITAGTSTDTLINTETNSDVFQAASFCPDQCGPLNCE